MTDNIQKLYEVAGVEKEPIYSGSRLYNPVITGYDYPPFTAEKQLELIKWLAKRNPIHISVICENWIVEGMIRYNKKYTSFYQALAGLILELWDELSSEQREEVKGILQ